MFREKPASARWTRYFKNRHTKKTFARVDWGERDFAIRIKSQKAKNDKKVKEKKALMQANVQNVSGKVGGIINLVSFIQSTRELATKDF